MTRSAASTLWSMVGLLMVCGLWLLDLGCAGEPPKYGAERPTTMPGVRQQVWAVAPAINLSGQREVDALLQADLLFAQLQQVKGLTVIPVNRVAEVYTALGIDKVQSQDQAAAVCNLLGCDGLLVPTITLYDPYTPPKLGAALQLFARPRDTVTRSALDPHDLAAQAAPSTSPYLPTHGNFVQAVGVFDAANGSTRAALMAYAEGRFDPQGPLQAREYMVVMDRYTGFVYHQLIVELLNSPQLGR